MGASISIPRYADPDAVYLADSCDSLRGAAERGAVKLRALARGHYPGEPLGREEAPGLLTAGFWDAQSPQDWGLEWHRNEGVEITYLARGSAEFFTRDGAWTLRPGQFTVTRPWQEHRVGNPSVGASFLQWLIVDVGVRRPHQDWEWPAWIALADPDLDELSQLLTQTDQPVWDSSPALRDAFGALRVTVEREPADEGHRASDLQLQCSAVLLATLRHLEGSGITRNPELARAGRSVEMFLGELGRHLDHDWTLDEMATTCGLGRTQFSSYVREQTNMSPIELLTFRRLERAAELLASEPETSITDIAFSCGFQSSQYFATTFRQRFGVSPRQYRQ